MFASLTTEKQPHEYQVNASETVQDRALKPHPKTRFDADVIVDGKVQSHNQAPPDMGQRSILRQPPGATVTFGILRYL
jgi:hypothetical protein